MTLWVQIRNYWSHSIKGGRFSEMLPHPIYLLQAFLGNDLRVEGVITEKLGQRLWMPLNELQVLLRGKQGTGHVYVSFNAARFAEFVEIYGTKKILRIDLTNQTIVLLGPRTPSKVDSALDNLQIAGQLTSATVSSTCIFLLVPEENMLCSSFTNHSWSTSREGRAHQYLWRWHTRQ